jgi:hypothetical protein
MPGLRVTCFASLIAFSTASAPELAVDVHLRVRDLGGLLLHGLDHLGVAVAGVDHGDADHEVEPLAAVGVVDPAALGVVDGDRRHRPEEVGHVLHVRGLVRHVVTSSSDRST